MHHRIGERFNLIARGANLAIAPEHSLLIAKIRIEQDRTPLIQCCGERGVSLRKLLFQRRTPVYEIRQLALKRRVVLYRATVRRHVARHVDLRADEARLHHDNADAELPQLHPQCV